MKSIHSSVYPFSASAFHPYIFKNTQKGSGEWLSGGYQLYYLAIIIIKNSLFCILGFGYVNLIFNSSNIKRKTSKHITDKHVLDSRVSTDNFVKRFNYRNSGEMHTVQRKSPAKNAGGSCIVSILYNIIYITQYFIYCALTKSWYSRKQSPYFIMIRTWFAYILSFPDPFKAGYASLYLIWFDLVYWTWLISIRK